jgi:hypothetical protein
VKTKYLGQYTDVVANMIAGELEAARIGWFYKQASWITKALFVGEWGTRLFVDETRFDEAQEIAKAMIEEPLDDE